MAPGFYGQHGLDTRFRLSPPHAPSIFKSRRPPAGAPPPPPPVGSERGGKISTTSRLTDWFPRRGSLWGCPKILSSVVLGAPTPTDFFLDCCVSCSARGAVSELPRGVHEQEGVRFGEVGILPLQLARRRTPCVCFVALPATQTGMLFPSLFRLLNYLIITAP